MERTNSPKPCVASAAANPSTFPRSKLFSSVSASWLSSSPLREIDINPVLASPEQLLALDARMVLFPSDVPDAQLPRPAIRPYPSQYISRWQMKDASEVTIRPIRPEDEPLLVAFHHTLSDSSVYLRYFQIQKLDSRVAHERLIRKLLRGCRHWRNRPRRRSRQFPIRRPRVLAVARLTRQLGREEAELGVLVTDRYQGSGLGRELVARLIQIARAEKIPSIVAHILPENAPMLALARRFHFTSAPNSDPASHTAILHLD